MLAMSCAESASHWGGTMRRESSAYVTADYAIKYQAGERAVDSGGIATHVLVKEQGRWKIRHSMTAARRRAPGGAVRQRPGR